MRRPIGHALLLIFGHGDEVGSTVAIANATGATVLAPCGLNSWLVEQGIPRAQVPKNFFQPGDRFTGLQGITVRSVESVHGSELVYFAGSTAAMAEQGLWAQMYKPNLATVHMGADTEPIDFAEQVKLLSTDNPNLKTVFPHHNRVAPPAGQTTVADVQTAMDNMGDALKVTQPALGEVVTFP